MSTAQAEIATNTSSSELSSVFSKTPPKIQESLKFCTIILMAGQDLSLVELQLRQLEKAMSNSEYELILVNDRNLDIDFDRFRQLVPNLIDLTVTIGSNYDQACVQAAQKATADWLLFVNKYVILNEDMLRKFIVQLTIEASRFGTAPDECVTLIKKDFLLEFSGFTELFQKIKEQPELAKCWTYHHQLLATLMNYVNIEGKKILAVGCSGGLECELLRRCGVAEVVGLDVAEYTGRDYKHPVIKYVKASATQMPFDDNVFDVCFSIASLEHIQNPGAAIKEMVRVTKKGGIIYCYAAPLWNSSNGHHSNHVLPDPWIHLRKNPPEQLKAYYADICDNYVREESMTVEAVIDKIFTSNDYNRVSLKGYIAILEDISNITDPLQISFGIGADKKSLTPEIREELKEYPEEELVAANLLWVLKKI